MHLPLLIQIPDDTSLVLLGAETTYADVDYMVEADVFFCDPQNDYLVTFCGSIGGIKTLSNVFRS